MQSNKSYKAQVGRLISYAKGLGLNVYFRDFKKGDPAAEWPLDGTEITLYIKKRQSKIQIIIALIHELAHHLDHIYTNDREYNHKLDAALDKNDKKSRYIVYKNELNGMKFWETIYKETNLTFPIRKLYMEMEYDAYWYQIYYETGKGPTTKQLAEFRRQLRKKYNYKLKK